MKGRALQAAVLALGTTWFGWRPAVVVTAFTVTTMAPTPRATSGRHLTTMPNTNDDSSSNPSDQTVAHTSCRSRRHVLSLPFVSAAIVPFLSAGSAVAANESVTTSSPTSSPTITEPPLQLQLNNNDNVVVAAMKDFRDPQGLFFLQVPADFFTLRRSAKGDLPDERTGVGRRGSSIFTAGNMGKAEVIAVERFPTRVLLEENGIQATGKLDTFPDLGEPAAIANLISLRRDRDKPAGTSNTRILPDSLLISQDGKELHFQLSTEIDVQKPELLMETYGVSQLFRVTTAKASLRSNDGNLLAVFASALEKDFYGPDGVALQQAVKSFVAIDQQSSLVK